MKITEIELKLMLYIILCIDSIFCITGMYQCCVKNLKLSCVLCDSELYFGFVPLMAWC